MRGEIRILHHVIKFHEECPSKRVIPKSIVCRISWSRVKISYHIDMVYLLDERHFKITKLAFLKRPYRQLWRNKLDLLSLFDTIRFCCYLRALDQKTDKIIQSKHNTHLSRYGSSSNVFDLKINNFSNYFLNETEEFVLKHGLRLRIPPPPPHLELTENVSSLILNCYESNYWNVNQYPLKHLFLSRHD